MFTGIITEIGIVSAVKRTGEGLRLTLKAPRTAATLKQGGSVCLDGACQTAVAVGADAFSVETVEETLKKTTLGSFEAGTEVNLELPVRPQDGLGGHIVQGHVDCVGSVAEVSQKTLGFETVIEFPAEFIENIVPIGSIAVDGISLTVASTEGSRFTVAVIPHTWEHTTLGRRRQGDKVNLEFDILGKYVLRHLRQTQPKPLGGITESQLREWGY